MFTMDADTILIFVILCGLIALGFAFSLIRFILRQEDGSAKVREIAESIHRGAMRSEEHTS